MIPVNSPACRASYQRFRWVEPSGIIGDRLPTQPVNQPSRAGWSRTIITRHHHATVAAWLPPISAPDLNRLTNQRLTSHPRSAARCTTKYTSNPSGLSTPARRGTQHTTVPSVHDCVHLSTMGAVFTVHATVHKCPQLYTVFTMLTPANTVSTVNNAYKCSQLLTIVYSVYECSQCTFCKQK